MVTGIVVSDRDIEIVWYTLMSQLCPAYRSNARNGRPTDYKIEQLRTDRYEALTDAEYFRALIQMLADRYREIEVKGDTVKLTEYGLDNWRKYDPLFSEIFSY